MSTQIRSEYDAISLKAHWPGLSIATFILSLLFDYGRAWIWPKDVVLTVGGLCFAGTLAGLLGWRHSTQHQMAKVGVTLNGMVCVFLVIMAMIYRWY